MQLQKTKFDKALLIEPTVFEDNRGFFMETYNKEALKQVGITDDFIQDNHSLSVEVGVIRGLHFQNHPNAQAKLVRVISGEILDVIVDIRKNSPTYGQWESYVLSAKNKKQLYVPVGFAHGFCTLAPQSEIVYKTTEYYAPQSEGGIRWDDPKLAINWSVNNPILSEKDKHLPFLKDINCNFEN